MFRRWFSSFIKRYKNVIMDVAKKIAILIMISLLAKAIMSGLDRKEPTSETKNSISFYNPERTIVEGEEVSKELYNEDEKTITNFVNLCNNKKIELAYNLLSDDCKKELYPDIEDFSNYYYSKLFKSNKSFNLQSWINDGKYHTYRIRFIDDILSTGEYDNSQKGQDYITIDLTNGEKKISLNGYIKKEEINKETGGDELKALVLEKKTFVDFEEYTVKIKNITKLPIIMDTKRKLNTIKLIDENKVEYYVQKDQIINLDKELSPGIIRTFKMRFNKTYSSNVKDENIQFSDIVTDVKKYKKEDNYNERVTMNIEV